MTKLEFTTLMLLIDKNSKSVEQFNALPHVIMYHEDILKLKSEIAQIFEMSQS